MSTQSKRNKIRRHTEMNAAQQLEARLVEEKLKEIASRIPEVKCSCGCTVFLQGLELKVVTKTTLNLSGFPAQMDMLLNLPVHYCAKCKTAWHRPEEAKIIK